MNIGEELHTTSLSQSSYVVCSFSQASQVAQALPLENYCQPTMNFNGK